MRNLGVNCTQILALAKVYRWSNFNHNFITNKEKVSTQHLKAKISLKKEGLKPPPPRQQILFMTRNIVKLVWPGIPSSRIISGLMVDRLGI